MGCAQSKIDNEESVSRCKDRKILMKQAVAARNTFAAAHFGYAIALKNTGVALSGYAHGEAFAAENPEIPAVPPPSDAAAVPPPPPPPQDPQEPPLPPPPPLPSFSPSPASLQRSVTMPELPVSKRGISRMGSISGPEDDAVLDEPIKNQEFGVNGGENTPPPPPPSMAWDYFYMNEEDDEEEDEDDDLDHHHHRHLHNHNPHDLELDHDNQKMGSNVNHTEFEYQTPEKMGKMEVVVEEEEEEEEEEGEMEMETSKSTHFTHSNTAPPDIRRSRDVVVGTVNGNVSGRSSVNWFKVLKEIDDCFLKASECAQEVSKLLEANRFQYHYNFADSRVPVDHAARVMRVITWNRPGAAANGKDDYYGEENETHAIVLDKLLAWEKKLYDEVKAGELMKMEYQRKVSLLTKQKKRGASAESLEKTKAAVSHLHTRYIVDMQSMDSTVSEVNELRDRQLFPKLAELVDAMANMWENMSTHHDEQLKIVNDLKHTDIIVVSRETTMDHHTETCQFLEAVEKWQSQFENLVTNQKNYVGALHSWLKLNLIPIESTLKEKISSPPRIQDPPIKPLIQSWHEFMEKLPDELVITAISSFVALIRTIKLHQEEEMKLKEKWEDTNKEYLRKKQGFEEWFQKHNKRIGGRAHHGDMDDEAGAGPGDELAAAVDKDPIAERRFAVETLKKRLDDELEDHRKHCLQVREKSMGSLKTRLPELFRAMSDYSHACADAYIRLRFIALSPNPDNGGPS